MKFSNPRTFALLAGIILFAIGFFGFAFRSAFELSDKYLLLSLVMGFWGLVAYANTVPKKG